jgi:hypothetical protein
MAISKKPVRNNSAALLNEIINKGGSTPSAKKFEQCEGIENIKITLRLPEKMLYVLDNHLKDSLYSKTRNTWIREAIERKIKEEIAPE